MRFRIDNEDIDVDLNSMKWGEAHEATKTLGVKFDPEDAIAVTGVALFIALRRKYPDMHPVQIADKVSSVDFANVREVEDDAAPLPVSDNGAGTPETILENSGTPA